MNKNALRNILVIILAMSLVFCTSCSSAKNGSDVLTKSNETSSYKDGIKVEKGSIKIVDLHGTWNEMGQQYGKLLKGELSEVYDFIADIMDASEENAEKAHSIVATQDAQRPNYIKQFMQGAAETSGLSLEKLGLIDAVERIAGLPQCSAAAAWGEYSTGPLVLGRNYDYGDIFKELSDDVVVTVYHPADGSLATATIGYAGEIYAVNGINEKGIFLELNNGKPSASMKSPDMRITGTTLLFDVLFSADSLDYMDLYFETVQCSSSYVINVADSETVHSYEWCPIGMERGDGYLPDGVFASTNHYVSTEWDLTTPTDESSWMSLTRRDNLIKLCESSKGSIDANKMMEIIETPIENGGSMNELTVYQIVVVPETLTLWLQITGSAEWTEIDLDSFLNSK